MDAKLSDVKRIKICQIAQECLWKDEEESVEALDYLRKERCLSDEVIKKFQFGYCPTRAKQHLSGIELKFVGKIIMPLFAPNGEVVALTSRDFRTMDPKLKHWHESFEKARYLYGIDVARDAIMRRDKAIVVEGQFDTCILHSVGINIAVGILGSAFTYDHVCCLASYCSEVYLIFDDDDSGIRNMSRAMSMHEEKYMSGSGISFIPVSLAWTECKDPDDFVRKHGPGKLIEIMKEAKLSLEGNIV